MTREVDQSALVSESDPWLPVRLFFWNLVSRRNAATAYFIFIFMVSVFFAISLSPGKKPFEGSTYNDGYLFQIHSVTDAAKSAGLFVDEYIKSLDQPLATRIALALPPPAGNKVTIVLPIGGVWGLEDIKRSPRTFSVDVVFPPEDGKPILFSHFVVAALFFFIGLYLLWFGLDKASLRLGQVCVTLPTTLFHPSYPGLPLSLALSLWTLHAGLICAVWFFMYLYIEQVSLYRERGHVSRIIRYWGPIAMFAALYFSFFRQLYTDWVPILTQRFQVQSWWLLLILPWMIEPAIIGSLILFPAVVQLCVMIKHKRARHIWRGIILTGPILFYVLGLWARVVLQVTGHGSALYAQLITYPFMLLLCAIAMRAGMIRTRVAVAGTEKFVTVAFIPITLMLDLGLSGALESRMAVTFAVVIAGVIAWVVQKFFVQAVTKALELLTPPRNARLRASKNL